MAHPEESQGQFESEGIEIQYTGIGPIRTSASLQKINLEDVSLVINLGTCGSFEVPVGELVEAQEVLNRDLASLEPLQIGYQSQLGIRKVRCGSGSKLETSPSASWEVMDMEAWTIAQHCKNLNKPCLFIKYVTDNSRGNVFSEWKKQLPKAAASLIQAYQRIVQIRSL